MKKASVDNGSADMDKRWESGDRDKNFLVQYLASLGNAYKNERANDVAEALLDPVADTFAKDSTSATCSGTFNDNNWHHAAVTVNRTSGRAQTYVDGKLNTYFDANDLGGIASAYINLGARVWSSDTTSVKTTDNYFKGEIDEFRLWNLYRSESIVSETFTQQLDGTEQGLMAYYPFEAYADNSGLKELVFSQCDAKVQKDPSIVIPPIEITDSLAIATKVSAPVKSKGPVSKLLYDFVVNNDALIITLKDPYDRIEKTIVNFTVTGVL